MSVKSIPLSVPQFGAKETEYVMEAVNTGWVSTGGPHVTRFEEKLAAYMGAEGAVACQSGTAGLHMALLLSGITAADGVLVPTLTFIAAVNPVRYVGATPFFMDCDESLCIDPVKTERFCRQECDFDGTVLTHRATGRPIRAVVAVHVFGNLADMDAILALAEEFHLMVIEDATEALGSRYADGRYAGTLGDVGVYSFNGNKIITTGGGGMLVSRHPEWLRRARHLSTQAKSDDRYYTHDEVGYNYRMTNLQAALGLAQLERLEEFISIKHRNFTVYAKALSDLSGAALLEVRAGTRSNRWFYGLLCRDEAMRDGLMAYLAEKGIQSRPVWGLIHKQIPYTAEYAYDIERAEDYGRRVLNLPCSVGLTEEEAAYVAQTVCQYVAERV